MFSLNLVGGYSCVVDFKFYDKLLAKLQLFASSSS
jgi:hypothetical protein